MSARMHGTAKGSTLLFATLILATFATWGMGSPRRHWSIPSRMMR